MGLKAWIALFLVVLGVGAGPDDIALIGAGIGGGAFSYYHRKFSNTNTTIHAFDRRDYVGGRLKHTQIDGQTVELGGDAWSSANEYVVELVKELGINTTVDALRASVADPVTAGIAVWDGSGFVSVDRTLFRHMLSDIAGAAQEGKFLWALRRNYAERGAKAFRTVDEFVAHGSLDTFTTTTARRYYSEHHVAEATQVDLAEPLMRVIYDQGLEAHAFSSLVAFTSLVGSASVAAGNSKLVEALFHHAGTNVALNTTVKRVIANDGGGFTVESESGGVKRHVVVDKVVLATPIEFAAIEFVNVSMHVKPRPFVHCHVTLVTAAGVNPAYFGLKAGDRIPDNILTTAAAASSTPFNVLHLEMTLDGKNQTVFKLFSNQDLRAHLSAIFIGITRVQTQNWPYTFPHLVPVAKPSNVRNASGYQPIALADGIYYLNAMESVASAMEGSVIAGRNVALLLSQGR